MTDGVSPIARYGYFTARDKAKHGDAELAAACEAFWTNVPRAADASEEISATEGVSAWITTTGDRTLRRIHRNQAGGPVVETIDRPDFWPAT